MRRIILIVAFALVVGSGAIVASAQGGTSQMEALEAGASAGCSTPITGLTASPEVSPAMAIAATAVASPMVVDGCATPEAGTPAG